MRDPASGFSSVAGTPPSPRPRHTLRLGTSLLPQLLSPLPPPLTPPPLPLPPLRFCCCGCCR